MAKLVYFSITLQTQRFVNKLPEFDKYRIERFKEKEEIKEPYILVVPTYEAAITQPVNEFLETGSNLKWCRGLFGGGNRNFAQLFAFTVDDLSQAYGLPVLHKFEFQGSDQDVQKLREELAQNAE